MIQNLGAVAGEPVSLSFTPTLAPMSRGILATCTAKAKPGLTAGTLRTAYQEAYAAEPFVGLLPEGQWPATSMTLGANSVLVQVALDERAGRVVVVAAIDNLTKGTAGGAIQSANLALGLPEELGLTTIGVSP
jgi:N-acetyl-gamma-glutamyl-phosphate reductase